MEHVLASIHRKGALAHARSASKPLRHRVIVTRSFFDIDLAKCRTITRAAPNSRSLFANACAHSPLTLSAIGMHVAHQSRNKSSIH
jgi:hypothetical protein